MKSIKLLMLSILLVSNATAINANECKFILENIQFGDSLDRVKEKKIGWDYLGLQVNSSGGLVASFTKSISNVEMNNKWCICSWLKIIGAHFDKEEKFESIKMIIVNTINKNEVNKDCNKADIDKCIDSGSSITGSLLGDFILKYGNPVEKQEDTYTKFIWEDGDFKLIMLWSPIKTTISLMKSNTNGKANKANSADTKKSPAN